jgi:hypothetical protein
VTAERSFEQHGFPHFFIIITLQQQQGAAAAFVLL